MDEELRRQLAGEIAAQVLRILGADAPGAGSAADDAPDSLVLISAPLAVPNAILQDVKAELGSSVRYLVFDEHLAYAQTPMDKATPQNRQSYTEQAARVQNVLLLAPRVSTLANIAQGEEATPLEELLLRCILWGKRVEVWLDFSPVRFKRNTFYEKVASAVEALQDMGITVKAFDWLAGFGAVELPTLITEQDVADAAAANVYEIKTAVGAIITPSAKDKAAQHGIRFVTG